MPIVEHHLGRFAQQVFLLPPYFDYFATFLWAVSGALLGARRGYALLGIATVAIVSSAGGGLLRDALFLQRVPVLLRLPIYLYIIAGAVVLVVLFGGCVQRFRQLAQILALTDAAGLGAYAVVGMNLALAAKLSTIGVILVGMVNAVGGGILRDVLNRERPVMFNPGTFEEASALIGCGVFIALIKFTAAGQFVSAWLTIALVFVIRLAAIRFGLKLEPLPAFREYWGRDIARPEP